MKIDLHAHILPRDCFNMTDREGRMYGLTLEKDASGQEVVMLGGKATGVPSLAQVCDPERRIQDMDKIGLDMQALSFAWQYRLQS